MKSKQLLSLLLPYDWRISRPKAPKGLRAGGEGGGGGVVRARGNGLGAGVRARHSLLPFATMAPSLTAIPPDAQGPSRVAQEPPGCGGQVPARWGAVQGQGFA